jgi:hypothetical protein
MAKTSKRYDPEGPGWMSFTKTVPASVPSLIQSSGPVSSV